MGTTAARQRTRGITGTMAGSLMAGSVLLAGCGLFSSAPPPQHHTTGPAKKSGHHHTKSPPSSTGNGTATSNGTGNGTSNGTSNGTGNGTGYGAGNGTGSGTGSSQAPPGPGSYSSLTVQVVSMTQVGTATTSGNRLPVWLVRLSITNPTTALVPLMLNDFTVVPSGATGTNSYNDSAAGALTSTNSLFWPISTSDPAAHPAYIPSGATVTGDVTVEVSTATQYRWVWGSPTTGTAATTFSASG
ncbi:MAG: hypothetical protein M0Z54_14520 [Thermaerobacter sp.]|nr:hypothetical protein [Thermaerobacter sp.]